MSPVVQLLRELIAIPSVNPDGAPASDVTGEKRMAERVAQFLESIGANAVLEEVLPGRPNVIGRFPTCGGADSGKPKILFAPHLDTVTIDGMTIDPFGGEVRDGRIYGRGACDTKGTMAAMLIALQEIGDRLPELNVEVHFAAFMGEETGQPGSQHFAKHHPDYDFALIGEPTECDVVYTTKGNLWAKLITKGVAVHSSTPHLGENAIVKMARVVDVLYNQFRPKVESEAFAHPVLGTSTTSIGIIRGGSRTNIVPDDCELQIDMRITPALHDYGAEKLLREALAAAEDLDVELQILSGAAPMDNNPDNPFIIKLAAGKRKLIGAPWFCDAAFLGAVGIPAVAAGPGNISQAHTKDEYIEIAALEEGVQFYRHFLESL
ncbi:MAG: M20 family metallopeptidase [Verrucomicrobiae bacterium]|nr:M20 family metallopeptidase [Verrucomicrobiae bacterium]